MARRTPKTESKGRPRTVHAGTTLSVEGTVSAEAEVIAAQEIDQIIARLDAGIAEEKKAMEELLSRLRSSRVAA
jgi:hypothetical protein